MLPNPRLQRTPSASPPSPLSRKPLGATKRQLAATTLLLMVVLSCSRGHSSATLAVSAIRNSDISWDGNLLGLMPQIHGSGSKKVLELGKAAVPDLVRALDDPDRFAAAHVLLTEIEMAGVSRRLDAAQWNGMRVELFADGSVRLHPEQREELKAFWKARPGGA